MVSFIPYPNLHTNRYVFYSNLSVYVFSRISRQIADAMLKKLGKKFAQVQEPPSYAHFFFDVFGGRNIRVHGGSRNVHSMD